MYRLIVESTPPALVASEVQNTATLATFDVTAEVSSLLTPDLVFSPVSPATTTSDSMPSTPSPCTHHVPAQFVEANTEEPPLCIITDARAIAGLGLQLDISAPVPLENGSDDSSGCSSESGNNSFHMVIDNPVSPSRKNKSSNKFLKSFVHVGLGFSFITRQGRRKSTASSAHDSSEVNVDVDLESGITPEARKRNNRVSRFFGRS